MPYDNSATGSIGFMDDFLNSQAQHGTHQESELKKFV